MDDGSSGLVTIQLDPYMFLTQNYIRLESNSFRARSLDNLFQISNFFEFQHQKVAKLDSIYSHLALYQFLRFFIHVCYLN